MLQLFRHTAQLGSETKGDSCTGFNVWGIWIIPEDSGYTSQGWTAVLEGRLKLVIGWDEVGREVDRSVIVGNG